MTIVYAVICRAKDAAVLVEKFYQSDVSGNIPQITTGLMEHLRDHPDLIRNDELRTFVQDNRNNGSFFGIDAMLSDFIESCTMSSPNDNSDDDDKDNNINNTSGDNTNGLSSTTHYFHLFFKDGIYYCCLSDSPEARYQKVNYAFLHKIHQEFVSAYTRRKINTMNAYGMEKTFASQLQLQMHYYNLNQESLSREEHIAQLLAQVDDMKNVMGRNVQLLYNRGESLQKLVQMSDDVRTDTGVFKKRSSTLEYKQHAEISHARVKFYMFVALASLVLLYLFFVGLCGWNLQYCRISH